MWTVACRACSSASLGDTCYHLQRLSVSIHWGHSGPHLSGVSFLSSLGWNPLAPSCTFSLEVTNCCVVGSREGKQIISLRMKVEAIVSCYVSDEFLLFY